MWFRNIDTVPALFNSGGTDRHGKQIIPGPIWYLMTMTSTVTDYSAIFSISYTSKLFLLIESYV